MDPRASLFRTSRFLAALITTVVLVVAATARGGTITSTWDGTTGMWTDATRWSSAEFPNNGNGGETYDAVVNSGDVTVTVLDENITIDTLTFGVGVISNDLTLTLVGPEGSSWTRGTLTGAGETVVNGNLTVTDASPDFADSPVLTGGQLLTNNATATLTQGDWRIEGAGTQLANNATLELRDGTSLTFSGVSGAVVNTGSLIKAGGSGTAVVDVDLENALGTVEARTGTLSMRGNVDGGAFQAAPGARLEFTGGGTQTLGAISGAGTVAFTGGAVTLNDGMDMTGGTTRFEGGTTTFASGPPPFAPFQLGSLEIVGGNVTGVPINANGPSLWTDGTLSTVETTITGDLTVTDIDPDVFAVGPELHGALRVDGNTTFTVGDWFVETGGRIENNGTFRMQDDTLLSAPSSAEAFSNMMGASLIKDGGPGEARLEMFLQNGIGSLVEAQSGTLRLEGGVMGSGTFRAAAGGTLEFAGINPISLGADSQISGAGTVVFNSPFSGAPGSGANIGGTLVMSAGGTTRFESGLVNLMGPIINFAGLELVGGDVNLMGTSGAVGSGPTLWTDGILSGGPTGRLTLSDAVTVTDADPDPDTGPILRQVQLVTTGPVTLTEGDWRIEDQATFQNLGGLMLADNTSLTVGEAPGMPGIPRMPGRLINNADLIKATGAGTSTVSIDLENDGGTVEVREGTLRLDGSVTGGGTFRAGSGALMEFLGSTDVGGSTQITGTGTVVFGGEDTLPTLHEVNGGTFAMLGGTTRIEGGRTTVFFDGTGNEYGSLEIFGGSAELDGSGRASGPSLWTGGQLTGAGTTTFSGGLTVTDSDLFPFTGPELDQGHRLVNQGLTTLTQGQWFLGGVVENQGMLDIQNGTEIVGFGTGLLVNTTTGILFSSPCDPAVLGADCTLFPSVFRSLVGINVENQGIVEARPGNPPPPIVPFDDAEVLSLQAGVTGTGTFRALDGALLEFAGGFGPEDLVHLETGSMLTGAGQIAFTGGESTIDGTFAMLPGGTTRFEGGDPDNRLSSTVNGMGHEYGGLEISGFSDLNFEGTGTARGASSWTGGTLAGAGTTTVSDTLTVGDDEPIDPDFPPRPDVLLSGGHTLINTGTTTLIAGDWLIENVGSDTVFENQGTFDVRDDTRVTSRPIPGAAPGTLRNTALDLGMDTTKGSFVKSSGAGTSTVTIDVENAGLVEAQAGTLSLKGNVTGAGEFAAAAGARLELRGSDLNSIDLAMDSMVIGAGTVVFGNPSAPAAQHVVNGTFAMTGTTRFEGGTTTVVPLTDPMVSHQYGSLEIAGGNVVATGTAEASGPSEWTQGELRGAGTTTVNGLTVRDTGATFDVGPILDGGHTLVNTGDAELTLRDWRIEGLNTKFENKGVFSMNDGTRLLFDPSDIGGKVVNETGATFRKSQGLGTAIVEVDFENKGTVDVGSGTLRFNRTTPGGTGYQQTAGSTQLTGGTLRAVGPSGGIDNVEIQNGTLEGAGLIDGTVLIGMPMDSTGKLAPGLGAGAGALTIAGNLFFGTDSGLDIQLGSTDPADFDTVAVMGRTLLNGVLSLSFIEGFQSTVQPTDEFTVLESGPTLTGAFLNVASGERLNTEDGFGSFEVLYGAGSGLPDLNSVVLKNYVANLVPEPGTASMLGFGLIGLALAGRRSRPRAA